MALMARTHLRFGSCERLLFLRQPERLERLLRHVLAHDYPKVAEGDLLVFYGELVDRVARLTAD
jgi:uncharacterized protein YdiU (UPF0061 family)